MSPPVARAGMPRSKGDTTSNPIPLSVQKYFDSLGLLSDDARLSLWQDLVRFHSDPLHEERKYMNLSHDREQLKTEVHNFLRQQGERHFSRQSVEPGFAVYQENLSTEEAYKPLFEILLYLCRRASQKRNKAKNKQDWKQWEAVRSPFNPVLGHDGVTRRETIVIDDEIAVPQSDSDRDYVPPRRPSEIASSPSPGASPGNRPVGKRQAQEHSPARRHKSRRTVALAQKAALYSHLFISSDDTELQSSPTQASPARPAPHVLVLKLPKLPPKLESDRRQLFTRSSEEAPLTRGAATRLASAARTPLPNLDPEPPSQYNHKQSSNKDTGNSATTRPAPSNTVSSGMVEDPINDPKGLPKLLPIGDSSRMLDQSRNPMDEVTGIQSTFRITSPHSNAQHPGLENGRKRPRDGSTSVIPANQGGPAKFSGTARYRPSPDHAKSNHPRPSATVPSTTSVAGGPNIEPCARKFTPINPGCGVQESVPESVPSNETEKTVAQKIDQPQTYQRPAESIEPRVLVDSAPMQKSTRPSMSNASTVEDEVTRKETTSGPSSTGQPVETAGDHGFVHGPSAAKPGPPQKLLHINDRRKRKVKTNLYIENQERALVPWSYDKVSDTTPEDLFKKIAEDNSIPSEQLVSITFRILDTTEKRSVTIARDTFQPGVALKGMVSGFFLKRKDLQACDIVAEPMVCESADDQLEVDDL